MERSKEEESKQTKQTEPTSPSSNAEKSNSSKKPVYMMASKPKASKAENYSPQIETESTATTKPKNEPFIMRRTVTKATNRKETEIQKAFPTLDRFGFIINTRFAAPENTKKNQKELTLRDNARIEKWRKMYPTISTMIAKRSKKLKTRIRKGIPESFRGRMWPLLAKIDEVKKKFPKIQFEKLASAEDSPALEDIQKDISRTFPEHFFFQGDGQKNLERVLKAISLVYEDLGYCQGMNFVCAMLLMYCNDEETFWIMLSLLSNYDLLDLYTDPDSVRRQLYVLDNLMASKLPKLKSHFNRFQMDSLHFGVSWWVSLFTAAEGVPFSIAVRVMDTLLFENNKILYRVGLNILKVREKQLLELEELDRLITTIREGLKGTEYEEDDDLFFKSMFSMKLTRKEIKQFHQAYIKEQ